MDFNEMVIIILNYIYNTGQFRYILIETIDTILLNDNYYYNSISSLIYILCNCRIYRKNLIEY